MTVQRNQINMKKDYYQDQQKRYAGSELKQSRLSVDQASKIQDEYLIAQDKFVKIEMAQRPSNKSNHDVSVLTEKKAHIGTASLVN